MATNDPHEGIDAGVRHAVRVLNCRGVETQQSCEGGPGHAYDRPTIDCRARADDAAGFAALSALVDYGYDVESVALHWEVLHGRPYEIMWRVVLRRAYPERAEEIP